MLYTPSKPLLFPFDCPEASMPRKRLYPAAATFLALAIAPPVLARIVAVQDSTGLAQAIAAARPGDDIVLSAGVYAITGKIAAKAAGTAAAPITVRAGSTLAAHIRSAGVIAFEVTAPYWHFADLDIRGVCSNDTDCEHAFHVVGNASFFQLTGSRLADFNAHLKVNADPAHDMPGNGLVENNEFFDTHPRRTDNPVAPVNIDNAANWVVRGNYVHDFQKIGAGENSYGIFVKGGSLAPVLERNEVICALDFTKVGGAPREMVGLSFGAHGMDAALCPPHWDADQPCNPEVISGIMRNNIVRKCSGDGIYLNKASNSEILFNTVENTGGIEFRFASSSGMARGNFGAAIRAADGGQFLDGGNAPGAGRASGFSPLDTTREAERLKAIAQSAIDWGRADISVAEDFCGRKRIGHADMGAVQSSLGPCPENAGSDATQDSP
jgi:parallel beta-helix repeat protein